MNDLTNILKGAWSKYQDLSGVAKNAYLVLRNKEPCKHSIESLLEGNQTGYFLEFTKDDGKKVTYRFDGRIESELIRAFVNLLSKDKAKMYEIKRI